MKTCNVWSGLSIAADTREQTKENAQTYLRSRGGRFNYQWFFRNLKDGIEDRVSLEALRLQAYKQSNLAAREPNWNRIRTMRRLYKDRQSKCSDAYIPEIRLAGGFIEFQTLVVRQDLTRLARNIAS
jgi:hypothetical protein